ncbi:Hypothetical predicted protein [Lecanosticta acicola]|uniref:Uncharacterized protein n=1 Tax=Lecanosticta acicola TaxID=111012 RepID=A0AAI8YT92_9PEZI|nr:Hypothetical predicted protein [Lecanosticta acicola]
MSNFAPETHLDAEGYHQMQMEHYRSKHSRTDAQRREAAIREARRHPQGERLIYPPETYTPNGGQIPPDSPPPPPVPPKDKRPASGRKVTNVLTGPDGLRMETAQAQPRRVINRSGSGRFRPEQSSNAPPSPYEHRRNASGASTASTVASAAPSRPLGHQRMGSAASAVPSVAPSRPSHESSRVSLESQRPPRPGSASSSIFSRTLSFGRTNTNESSTQRESTESRKPRAPRRSSFRETLRRASNEIQKDVSIMRMTPAERQRHFAAEKAKMDAEIEEHRRLNPLGRPKYQQEYIRQRDISRAGGGFQQYDEVLMHYGTDNPIAHLNANELTLAQDFALTYPNNDDDSKWEALADRQKAPPMNTGERAAFLLSRGLDAFKREKKAGRNMSTDSGMDFADCGEPDELECCERCGKPTTEWLVKGFCRDCHQARVNEFWDADSNPTPIDEKSEYDGSMRSSRASSPHAARTVNEEEYMKIARKRTIRRVRQTVYEDAGNPFAVPTGVAEDGRPSPDQMGIGSRFVSSRRNPSLSSWESLALSSPSHQILQEEHEQQPHVIRHLRDSLLHAPRPRRAGTPQLIRQHKYSDSAPDPMPEEVYVAPRTLWAKRGKSLPTNAMGEERNTQFYDFWEGVLGEYGSDMVGEVDGENGDGML